MTGIIVALTVAFLVSNLAWLYTFIKFDDKQREERFSLQERIRMPEARPVIPGDVPTPEPVELDELYAVGSINPPGIERTET